MSQGDRWGGLDHDLKFPQLVFLSVNGRVELVHRRRSWQPDRPFHIFVALKPVARLSITLSISDALENCKRAGRECARTHPSLCGSPDKSANLLFWQVKVEGEGSGARL